MIILPEKEWWYDTSIEYNYILAYYPYHPTATLLHSRHLESEQEIFHSLPLFLLPKHTLQICLLILLHTQHIIIIVPNTPHPIIVVVVD